MLSAKTAFFSAISSASCVSSPLRNGLSDDPRKQCHASDHIIAVIASGRSPIRVFPDSLEMIGRPLPFVVTVRRQAKLISPRQRGKQPSRVRHIGGQHTHPELK